MLVSKRWDDYFMKQVFLVSSMSKDRSSKCGTVLVGEGKTILSTGYNGFPRGVLDNIEERHERPEKYFWTEHGERNAIYNAARHGIKLLDSTAYISGVPCADCARALIQAGVRQIVVPTKETDPFMLTGRWDDWADSFRRTEILLSEAGVGVRQVPYVV